MRLNAYLAKAGITSRRKADELIKAGRVSVNKELGRLNSSVTEKDLVALDGKLLKLQKNRTIILNKPAGYVTTLDDPEGRPKVTDLVDLEERLVPIGRLDYQTTGLLLLTNDGELAHRLMHPKFKVDKTYIAEFNGVLNPKIINMLKTGIELEDGKTAPAKIKKLDDNKAELTIHEGRNRQVRRMLAAVGLTVRKLHRTKYGPIDLRGLKPGQWRDVTDEEISKLKS